MGAWIEISVGSLFMHLHKVAPYMGAWIEIWYDYIMDDTPCSRSLHGSVD